MAHGEKLTNNEDVDKVGETTYKSLVGCLRYLTASRPVIMFIVSLLSRYMHCCNVNHYMAAKRVLGTLNHGVKSLKTEKVKLFGYSNNDWVWSTEDMKSTSGYFFTLGSSKQETIAQSTVEAKNLTAATVVNQAIWLRNLLNDLNLKQEEALEMKFDNQSAIAINKTFLKSNINLSEKWNKRRNSQDQLTDILTKPLRKIKFEKLRYDNGVLNMEAKVECGEVTFHAMVNPDHKSASSPIVRAHQTYEDIKGASSVKRTHTCELLSSCQLALKE
ncbi:laccase-2-like [Gossypium australe]|uniref:Laccase-2-like n=1 Tax=Gossypium australe TaxID=47621 RepID=A0A5B6VC46_9ROSI|nr:laccase-2-like [Gossypium australe]